MESFQEDSQDPLWLQDTFRAIGKTKETEELDGNERKIDKNAVAAVRKTCRIGARARIRCLNQRSGLRPVEMSRTCLHRSKSVKTAVLGLVFSPDYGKIPR